VTLSGRGIPAGGITPARSFRTTFSQTSALSLTSLRFALSSARSARGLDPLWQLTQYRFNNAS
jgi:hypothetical protein